MDFRRFSWGRAPRALSWQVWTSLPSSMRSSCGVNYLFIYLFIWNRVTCSLNWPWNSQCSWECHWITEPPALKSPVLGLWMCSIVLGWNQILSVSWYSPCKVIVKLRDNTSKIIWPRTWNKVDSLRHYYLTSPCLKNYVFFWVWDVYCLVVTVWLLGK